MFKVYLKHFVYLCDYLGILKTHMKIPSKLLKRDSLSHGVNVTIDENKITIDLHIIVSYGVSISAVADNLISNVKYNVEEFSGLEVKKINIFVEGVRVID